MARKTRTKTPESDHEEDQIEITGEPAQTPTPAVESDDTQERIDALRNSGEDHSVRFSRWNDQHGGWEGVAKYPLAEFDAFDAAAACGGGRFRIQVVDARGRIVLTTTLRHRRVVGAPDPVPVQRVYSGATPLHSLADAGGSGASGLGGMLADAIRQALAPVVQRLDQVERSRDTLTLRDLLPILRPQESLGIKDLLPLLNRESERTPVAELVSALRDMHELTSGGDEAPQSGGQARSRAPSDGEIIRDIMPHVRAMIAELRTPATPAKHTSAALPAGSTNPAPPPPPAEEEANPEEILREYLLVGSAKPGRNPETYAILTIDVLGEEQTVALLAQASNLQLVDHLMLAEPRLSRPFIEAVVVKVRERITAQKGAPPT